MEPVRVDTRTGIPWIADSEEGAAPAVGKERSASGLDPPAPFLPWSGDMADLGEVSRALLLPSEKAHLSWNKERRQDLHL